MRKRCTVLSIVAIVAILVRVDYAHADSVTVQDNFNDGVLGPRWQIVTQTGGATWAESGGKLNVGGTAGQSDELVMRYNQPIADVGSVRIDYSWTSYGGHKARVGLGLFDSFASGLVNDLNEHGVYLKGVRYQAAGLHAVDGGFLNVDYYIDYSVPTSGSLMIERNGNDFRASYLDGATWHVLFEGQQDFGGALLYPHLFTSNSDSNPSYQVALDNFSAVVVPEPSSLGLALAGFVGLAALRWRR